MGLAAGARCRPLSFPFGPPGRPLAAVVGAAARAGGKPLPGARPPAGFGPARALGLQFSEDIGLGRRRGDG